MRVDEGRGKEVGVGEAKIDAEMGRGFISERTLKQVDKTDNCVRKHNVIPPSPPPNWLGFSDQRKGVFLNLKKKKSQKAKKNKSEQSVTHNIVVMLKHVQILLATLK